MRQMRGRRSSGGCNARHWQEDDAAERGNGRNGEGKLKERGKVDVGEREARSGYGDKEAAEVMCAQENP